MNELKIYFLISLIIFCFVYYFIKTIHNETEKIKLLKKELDKIDKKIKDISNLNHE